MNLKATLFTGTVLSVTGFWFGNSELFFHLTNNEESDAPHESFEDVRKREQRSVYILRELRGDRLSSIIGYDFQIMRIEHEKDKHHAYARFNQRSLATDERIRRFQAPVRARWG
jgi:hypothetical protein